MRTGKTAYKANMTLTVFLAIPAFGATVSNVTCSATVQISPTDYLSVNNPGAIPDSCSVPLTYGGVASASASGFTEIGGITQQPYYGPVVPVDSTVYGDISVSANSTPASAFYCATLNNPISCSSGASVSVSETITFQTLGPLRPGLAVLYSYLNRFDLGGGAAAGGGTSPGQGSSAVELGTTLSLSAFALATTGLGQDGEYALAEVDFWLVIYEADGVTPVTVLDVAATPEPSTWALALLPLSLLCAVSLRRRTARNALSDSSAARAIEACLSLPARA
jgi:hypothetical protein